MKGIVDSFGMSARQLASTTLIVSFIVSFGIVKACANLISGHLADTWGPQAGAGAQLAHGPAVPFMMGPHWEWIVAAKFLGADQRHDRAFDADHTADKRVDQHEQRELCCQLARSPRLTRSGSTNRSPSFGCCRHCPGVDRANLGCLRGRRSLALGGTRPSFTSSNVSAALCSSYFENRPPLNIVRSIAPRSTHLFIVSKSVPIVSATWVALKKIGTMGRNLGVSWTMSLLRFT
jgi:hypothetical protein